VGQEILTERAMHCASCDHFNTLKFARSTSNSARSRRLNMQTAKQSRWLFGRLANVPEAQTWQRPKWTKCGRTPRLRVFHYGAFRTKSRKPKAALRHPPSRNKDTQASEECCVKRLISPVVIGHQCMQNGGPWPDGSATFQISIWIAHFVSHAERVACAPSQFHRFTKYQVPRYFVTRYGNNTSLPRHFQVIAPWNRQQQRLESCQLQPTKIFS